MAPRQPSDEALRPLALVVTLALAGCPASPPVNGPAPHGSSAGTTATASTSGGSATAPPPFAGSASTTTGVVGSTAADAWRSCAASPFHSDEPRLDAVPFDAAQERELAVHEAVLAAPHGSDAGEAMRRAEAAFARARLHFEAHHYPEAAIAFRALALDPDQGKGGTGENAALLALESLSILFTHARPARVECADAMGADLARYLALWCTPAPSQSAGPCLTLARIGFDLKRLRAETLMRNGQRAGAPGRADIAEAGDIYRGLYEEACAKEPTKPPRATGLRCDELLYNAAVAYEAAGRSADARRMRDVLLDPKLPWHKGELAKSLAARMPPP